MMKVTIWSSISGPYSGYVIVDVPGDTTLLQLINLYCKQKAVEFDKSWELRDDGDQVLCITSTLTQAGIEHGDQLMLSPASSSSGVFQYGNWWTLALVCLLIGLLGISVVAYHAVHPFSDMQSHSQRHVKKYGVVVDAGSSHSSFFVFEWLSDLPQDNGTNLKLLHHCQHQGGLSRLIRQPSSIVDEYFSRCLQSVESSIPAAARPYTSIYLAATAGMRILRDFDPSGAAELLSKIRETFLSKTSLVVLADNVFIATGLQEGVGGWIATNYLLGALSEGNKNTEVTLDVGEASFRLTRALNYSTLPIPVQPLRLDILNVSYRLSSQTFMCYGILEAHNRHRYLLLQDALNTLHYRPTQTISLQEPQGAYSSESQVHLKPEYLDNFQSEPQALLGSKSAFADSQVTRRHDSRVERHAEPLVFQYPSNSSKEDLLSDSETDSLETKKGGLNESLSLELSTQERINNLGSSSYVHTPVTPTASDQLDKKTRRISDHTPEEELVGEGREEDVVVIKDPCSPIGYAKDVSHRSLLLPCTLTHLGSKRNRAQLMKMEVHQFHESKNNNSVSSKAVFDAVSGSKRNPDEVQFVTSMPGSVKKYRPGVVATSPDPRSFSVQQKLEALLSNYQTVANNLNIPISHLPYEIIENALRSGSNSIPSASFDQMLTEAVASASLYGRTAKNLDINSKRANVDESRNLSYKSYNAFSNRVGSTPVNIGNNTVDTNAMIKDSQGHRSDLVAKWKRHIDDTFSPYRESSLISSSRSVSAWLIQPQHGPELALGVYRLEGSSDGEQCLELVQKIFDLDLCRSIFHYGDCLDKSLVRPFSGNVLAFSEAFYLVSTALDLRPNTTLAQFRQKVVQLCSLDMDQHKRKDASLDYIDSVDQHCYQASYLYSLLTAGLGVTEETWQKVLLGKAVSQQPVEWTQGFMLHRVYQYYEDTGRGETTQVGHNFTNDSLGMSSSTSVLHQQPGTSWFAAVSPELLLLCLLFVAFLGVSAAFACHAHRLASGDPRYHRVLTDHIQAAMKV